MVDVPRRDVFRTIPTYVGIKTMKFENAGGGGGENRLTRIPVNAAPVEAVPCEP